MTRFTLSGYLKEAREQTETEFGDVLYILHAVAKMSAVLVFEICCVLEIGIQK